ncbi:MAG: hypothetical protein J1E36_02670 [Eubacterium sp.]|nr:hypothetical protein [Eubacterium sp.]
MKEYVPPKMEIDLFDDCELVTTSGGCNVPGCTINFSYGESPDPFGR